MSSIYDGSDFRSLTENNSFFFLVNYSLLARKRKLYFRNNGDAHISCSTLYCVLLHYVAVAMFFHSRLCLHNSDSERMQSYNMHVHVFIALFWINNMFTDIVHYLFERTIAWHIYTTEI